MHSEIILILLAIITPFIDSVVLPLQRTPLHRSIDSKFFSGYSIGKFVNNCRKPKLFSHPRPNRDRNIASKARNDDNTLEFELDPTFTEKQSKRKITVADLSPKPDLSSSTSVADREKEENEIIIPTLPPPYHEEPYSKDIVEKMAHEIFINIQKYDLIMMMSARWDYTQRLDCPFLIKYVSHSKYNILLFDKRELPAKSEMNIGTPFIINTYSAVQIKEFAQNHEFINVVKEQTLDLVCYLKAFDSAYAEMLKLMDPSKPFIVAGQKTAMEASKENPESVLASLIALDLKRRGHTVDLFIFNGIKKINVKYFILIDDKLPTEQYPTRLKALRRPIDEHLVNSLNQSFRNGIFWKIWINLAGVSKIAQLIFLPWDLLSNSVLGLDILATMACSGYLRAIERMKYYLDNTDTFRKKDK